jgi:hypothetical protein
MKMSRLILLLLAMTVVVQRSEISQAQSATFYVATNGSDSNPGSQAAPWRTVQKAANSLSAGQTALIRGGTYREQGVTFANSGSSSNRITLKNYPGETPVIDGGYTTSSGMRPVFAIEANYITLDGLTIIRGSAANISVSIDAPTTGFTLQNSNLYNFVTDDNSAAIYVNTGSDDVLIQNNYLHDRTVDQRGTTGSGVILFNAGDVTIQNNEIYNTLIGIYYKHSQPGSQTTQIRRNLIYNIGDRGILWAMHHAVIDNNIVYNAQMAMQVFEESASCGSLNSNANQILHNTFVDNPRGLNLVRSSSCAGALDTVIRDNVIHNFSNGEFRGLAIYAYQSSDTSRTRVERNLIYSASQSQQVRVLNSFYGLTSLPSSVTSSGNIATAPVFTNYAAKIFSLVSGAGKNAASDGTDMGAKACSVGVNGSPTCSGSGGGSGTGPSSPTGLRILSS